MDDDTWCGGGGGVVDGVSWCGGGGGVIDGVSWCEGDGSVRPVFQNLATGTDGVCSLDRLKTGRRCRSRQRTYDLQATVNRSKCQHLLFCHRRIFCLYHKLFLLLSC